MHHPNDSDEHIFSHRPQVEFTVEFRTGWRGGKSTDSNTHQKILEALFVCINNDRGCSVTTPNRFLHRQQVYFTAEFRTKSFSGFSDAPAFNQTRNINPTNPNDSDEHIFLHRPQVEFTAEFRTGSFWVSSGYSPKPVWT